MWKRWLRNLSIEWHWLKRDMTYRWHLDTPAGVMGMLTLISGLVFLIIIGNGFAHIFRSFVPWVSGSRVNDVYWQSVGFGLKTSFALLIFSGSLILFFLLKFSNRR